MNILKAYLLDLKKKIYQFFHINLYTLKQKELFDHIQVGDVVFCKMPLSEVELLKIPEGHRARPYLVADKKGSVLICFPGSHKKWSKVSLDRTLIVKKIVYPTYTNKTGNDVRQIYDSYFDLTELSFVPIENMSHISMSINDHYLKELATKLEIMKNRGTVIFNLQLPYQIEVEEGMVYEYENKWYYIYRKDKDDLYGYLISRRANHIKVEFQGKQWYIHYEEKIHIKDDHSFPVLYIFTKDKQNEIEEMINADKREIEDSVHRIPEFQTRFEVGTIFYDPFQDDHVLYLFTHHKRDYGIYLDEDPEHVYRIKEFQYYQNTKETMPKDELADLLENLDESEYDDENHIIVNYLAINANTFEDE